MKRRDDEMVLLTAIQFKPNTETVRDVIVRLGMPTKRTDYLLEKWARKGWYQWGVVIDMGWLTPEGKVAI